MSALVFRIEQGKPETQGKEQQISEGTLGETIQAPDTPVSEQSAVETMSEPARGVTVQVDGPIGRVFTDALNKVLALEDYMTMLPEAMDEKEPSAEPSKGNRNLVQVYCWRTDAVNASDLVQLSNMISRHTDRSFVVALEAGQVMKSAVGVLESLTCYPNLKVCYSLETAARYVKELACPRT